MLAAAPTMAAEVRVFSSSARVVVVVNNDSPVKHLSDEQIAAIFLGRTRSFPDGSNAQPVELPESATAYQDFYRYLIGYTPPQLKSYWARQLFSGKGQPARKQPDSLSIRAFIARERLSIGFIEPQFVDSSVRVLRVLP